MKIKNLLLATAFISASLASEAQVQKVNYKVQFNKETNLFDCFMVVKEGKASDVRERVQYNAQFTVVVPAGSKVSMAKSYMPIQNNQKYDGTTPLQWSVANLTSSPESDPFRDFVSVVPALSPSAFYNNLNEGDEVKLFSLQISPIVDCGSAVRLFEANVDPNSSSRGMAGGDYSNGFTIGGTEQSYNGNDRGLTPTLDVIKSKDVSNNKGQLKIDVNLNLDQKYAPYSHVWQGPNDFKSYVEDFVIYNASKMHEGNYTLEITDNRGCKQNENITARVNGQNIGLDESQITKAEDLIETKVSIYPNPAVNFFNIDVQAKNGAVIAIDIIDAKGSIVSSKNYGAKATDNHVNVSIPLNDYTPGMYNVAISVDGEVATKKLMVIR
jgi:hypothetical protein